MVHIIPAAIAVLITLKDIGEYNSALNALFIFDSYVF